MVRFSKKFFLVWGVLGILVLICKGIESIAPMGFADLNSFAEFLIPRVVGIGMLIAVLTYFSTFLSFSIRHQVFRKGLMPNIFNKRINRVTRCYRCRKTLEGYTGTECQFCRWIRCTCGACGCGMGKP